MDMTAGEILDLASAAEHFAEAAKVLSERGFFDSAQDCANAATHLAHMVIPDVLAAQASDSVNFGS